MKSIVQGTLIFQDQVFPNMKGLFRELATSQKPSALFITCSDSRVVPELLTQQNPGDIFVIRNAGNIIPSYSAEPGGVTATVEYAVAVLGVKDIVVCGHSDCGAMTAVANCACMDHLPAVASWLRHADSAKAVTQARDQLQARHQESGRSGWGRPRGDHTRRQIPPKQAVLNQSASAEAFSADLIFICCPLTV